MPARTTWRRSDFDHLNLNAPSSRFAGPFGTLCALSQTGLEEEDLLGELASSFGFPVP